VGVLKSPRAKEPDELLTFIDNFIASLNSFPKLLHPPSEKDDDYEVVRRALLLGAFKERYEEARHNPEARHRIRIEVLREFGREPIDAFQEGREVDPSKLRRRPT
jgi:hypothetical protein